MSRKPIAEESEAEKISTRVVEHLTAHGRDDIFRPPFFEAAYEFDLLNVEEFRTRLVKDVRRFLLKPTPHAMSAPLSFYVPKTRFTYRQASWQDLAEVAKYLALVLTIAPAIEEARVPRSQRIVFSYRFDEAGPLFCPQHKFNDFRARSSELAKSGQFNVRVVTDISNFYDRLNLHRLEAILQQIRCPLATVKAINDLLSHWSGRNSYGIPVGGDASRLLAEAALINVDNHLRDESLEFIRYVDDYRFFCRSYSEAHAAVSILANCLEKEGLHLNSEKTRIQGIASAISEEDVERASEFTPIDESERVEKKMLVHVTPYKVRIAKYYKEPGKEAVEALRKLDLEALFEIAGKEDCTEDELKQAVKAYIYREKHDPELLVGLLMRHLHLIAYVCDALRKEEARFSAEEIERIGRALEEFYRHERRPPYYNLMIARLLSKGRFSRPSFIRTLIRSDLNSRDPVFWREMILCSVNLLDRPILLHLRDIFKTQPIAIQRAILFAWLTCDALITEERAAFLKVAAKEPDFILSELSRLVAYQRREVETLFAASIPTSTTPAPANSGTLTAQTPDP